MSTRIKSPAAKQTEATKGFEIVSTYSPIRSIVAPHNVQTFRCCKGKRTRIRFGVGTLTAARLDHTKPITLALLENGMYAVVQVAAGGVKLGTTDKGATYSASFSIPLHFANEAELLNGMWCFPSSTFKTLTPTADTKAEVGAAQ